MGTHSMIESGESGSTLKNKTVVPHWETQRDGDQDGREEAVESAQDVLPHWDNDLRRLMFRGKITKIIPESFKKPGTSPEGIRQGSMACTNGRPSACG